MSMKVATNDDFGVTATFDHICGHKVPLFYMAEKYAQLDEEREKGQVCIHCMIKKDFGQPILEIAK